MSGAERERDQAPMVGLAVATRRERWGAGVLVGAACLLPMGSTYPEAGALAALLGGIALFVLARTPAPRWAHAPRMAKGGVLVVAWAVILWGFDLMTMAGTPPWVLPAIGVVGVIITTVGALGLDRIRRQQFLPPLLGDGGQDRGRGD